MFDSSYKTVFSILLLVVAVLYYKYTHFQYYHPIYHHHPSKSTFLSEYQTSGWNNKFIRDHSLSIQEVDQFKRDGFLVIRNAIPTHIIDTLYLKRPKHTLSPYLEFIESLILKTTNSHFMFDCLWSFIDEYRDFWYNDYSPLIQYYIAPILGKNTSIRLLTDLLFGIKQTPLKLGVYHQDIQSFNMIDHKSKGISIWIPLMDINASSIGGSIILVNGTLNKFIDIINQTKVIKNSVTIPYFNKGDILLFDKFTIHKSQSLKDKNVIRYAYGARFFDGDNAFLNDTFQNEIMPKKNVCKHKLKNGDLLKSACYPQLWPMLLPNEIDIVINNGLEYPSHDMHFLFCVYNSLIMSIKQRLPTLSFFSQKQFT